MEILTKAIEKNLLPPNTLQLIVTGKISPEWIRKNLTSNREFMIEQLPEKLQEKINKGLLDEKYVKLFISGKSREEIEEVLVNDDDFFLPNFPSIFRDALQVCYLF